MSVLLKGFAWMPLLLLVPAWVLLARRLRDRAAAGRAAALAALGDPALLLGLGRAPSPAIATRRFRVRTLAVALALVALARPQGGTATRAGQGLGRDVLLALDLSRSMTVRDVGIDRLSAAKRTAREIVGALDIGDRAGLVIFGGAGFLQLPLTTDRDAFDRFLDAVSVELLDDPSTDLNAPLRTAATVFAHEGGDGHRALVILSDGDDEAEHREAAIADLAKRRIPVFTVGVGSAAGGLVPKAAGDTTGGPSNPWHVDGIGRPVESKLVAGPLREIAAGTRGVYTAFDDRAGRARVEEGLRAITARPLGVQRRTERTELFQIPLGLALLLLLAEPLLVREPRRPLAAASLLLAAGCAGGALALDAGTRAYRNGDHAAAVEHWRAAVAERPTPALHYNLGSALFRMGRYEIAVKEFAEAAAADGPLRTTALYNLGTAALRASEQADRKEEWLDRAIDSYEEVLAATPGDSLARWNLELAVRRRGDRDTGGSPGQGGRANAGRGQGREEGLNDSRETAVAAMAGGGSGSAEGESAKEIDEQEARKQLDALEREMLSTHEGRQAKRGQRSDRDW